MTEQEERAYEQGQRAVWAHLLQEAVRCLGYRLDVDSPIAWVIEREAVIAVLRQVCAAYGDNDWPDDGNLADVIEKHLWDYLEARGGG